MRSKDKIHVKVEKIGKKLWAVVRKADTGENVLVPSFEDIFRIILAIVYCENKKYASLPWPPSEMVRKFLLACIREAEAGELPLSAEQYEAAWERLDKEFQVTEGRERAKAEPKNCSPGCGCELCKEGPMAN